MRSGYKTAYRGSAYCFGRLSSHQRDRPTNLFAGTVNGVFLTTNNGTSWTAINAGLPNRPVGSLAVIGRIFLRELLAQAFSF